ncbi:MAG: NADH-quinone oxidoreductase subunit NuoN [Candidatus Eisenbacteria bacterium]|nr:NADH-quinone oxidoreductase subunit NuoN [Candidatus Latescibacterota bacterium]MBD3301851.1 NADH-quinone oxidoreductase subunit NuoN [Candidatus Eisenbacteria bacterium]
MSGFVPGDLMSFGPILVLAGGGVLLVVIDALLGRRSGFPWSIPTLLVLALAVGTAVAQWSTPRSAGSLSWLLAIDRFALFVAVLVCVSAALTVVLSESYLRRIGRVRGEFYSLLLLSCSGMVLFAATNELITLFLALELLSIPVYILSGYLRDDLRSGEAAMKYFFLGALSSAVFLLGIAFIYGSTGTTNLLQVVQRGTETPGLLTGGVLLLLTGFLFKIASVPFHMWAPDVYEGAPTTVTAFMATAVKAAAFGALLRVIGLAPDLVGPIPLEKLLWWLAVLTMSVGNLAALTQSNVKRMLAYSSIAHAGYLLIAVTVYAGTGDAQALTGLLYYLIAYTLMTIGAFAFVVAFGDENLEMGSYGALGWRYPALGIGMSLFMISLAGIPPTAGFFGKYTIFRNAVDHGYVPLVVIAVLNSALSVAYYFRVMVTLYMRPASGEVKAGSGIAVGVVVAVCAVGVLWAGFGPDGWLPGVPTLLSWAQDSVLALR